MTTTTTNNTLTRARRTRQRDDTHRRERYANTDFLPGTEPVPSRQNRKAHVDAPRRRVPPYTNIHPHIY